MIQRNVEFSVSCLRDHGCRILVVSPKSLDPFPYSKNYAFSDHAWQSKVDIGQSFTDRKSTRLNSSHDQISYAVFCLKKKVSYTLGISRVEPIVHNLLFERFINPGRTTYPDVDIDFSSERREEVIQYGYERYGADHTGMVCNLVTYRARSAVREVGYALGFPRPLVDRVAKALETYDSVMVRRDLEAEGGFAEFFRRPDDPEVVE